MAAQDMPPAEVDIEVDLVRTLVADQYPDLAGLPIRRLAFGWDNVSFRLGPDHVARLPRRELSAHLVSNEARWLPELASALPLPVPVPIFLGAPGHGYPWPWLIAPLLRGTPFWESADIDHRSCARQLGGFLAALHRTAPRDAPENPYRGGPLVDRDEATRSRLDSLAGVVDSGRLQAVWSEAHIAKPPSHAPVWLHGDLHAANLLFAGGKVAGVLDFGDITAGDPATDLAIAWTFVPSRHREAFWDVYGNADRDLRLRAKAWALSLGTAYLAFSADNPTMAGIGERALAAVLESD